MAAPELSGLEAMSIDQLRTDWRSRFCDEPPGFQSRDLMRRVLAERVQIEAEGPDPTLDKRLQQMSHR